jgi:uncharacterized protein (TIGR03437 family)
MSLFKLLSGLAAAACLLPAQAVNVVVDSGYRAPLPLKVAPGQVITLFVRPSSIRLTGGIHADTIPLPVSLGGFSATLRQTLSLPIAVPILSVNPIGFCPPVSATPACSYMVAVTVQIPLELIPNVELARATENFASLTVADNNVDGDPLQLNPVSENIHIVTSCDSTLQTISPPCLPLVKHSDGSLVTPKNPADVNELLTISAYGLGRTSTAVESGKLPVEPSNPVPSLKLGLRMGANPGVPDPDVDPSMAVLSTKEVGLYEVSFTAPAPDKNTPACRDAVSSNFSVSIGRGNSSDHVSLCVRVPEQ